MGRGEAGVGREGVLWKVKNSFPELVPSFHHLGPRDGNEVVVLGGKYLYLMNDLTSLHLIFFFFGTGSLIDPGPCWVV